MDPNQPAAPPPGNNYDFIVNPAERRTKVGLGGVFKNPFLLKVVLILVGIVVFVMTAGFIANLVLGRNKPDFVALTRLTQTQAEIMRIADIGDRTSNQTMRDSAVNDLLVLNTQ